MFTSHLLLFIAWLLFGVLHSVLATNAVKEKVRAYPFLHLHYRLLYNIFALLSFGAIIIFQWNMRSPFLFRPILSAGFIVAGSGLLLMAVCIRKYFLRLSGIKSLIAGQPIKNKLRIDGVHRYVRHPLYLGTFVFIWGLLLLIPQVSLLISNVVITVYTWIGTYFEERKLVKEFGDDYTVYQEQVPRILPAFKGGSFLPDGRKQGFTD